MLRPTQTSLGETIAFSAERGDPHGFCSWDEGKKGPPWVKTLPMQRRIEVKGGLAIGLGALALLGSAAGCKKSEAGAGAPPKPEASLTQSAQARATVSAAPVLSATPNARRRSDEKERAELAEYLKAMNAGRGATKAGNYSAAATAFTAALAARPGDPRAYAERGYAALLAKNYTAAEEDLNQAAQENSDRLLRSQIFFNLGLVREATGIEATSAFALSNFLRSTAAAQKKLVGKDTCPVEVDRSASAAQVSQYRDWLAFFEAHSGQESLPQTKPTSNEDARKTLCLPTGCIGASPWIVNLGPTEAFLVSETKTGLSAVTVAHIDRAIDGYCYPNVSAEMVQRGSGSIVVRVKEERGYNQTMCGDDGHFCTEKEFLEIQENPGSMEWIRGCRTEHFTTYKVLDVAKGRWSLSVMQYDDINAGATESERTSVTVDGESLRLNGPGCQRRLPLTSGDP